MEKWRRLLGLSPRWEFAIKLYATEHDTPEDERDCATYVETDGAYLRSCISFNLWHRECRKDIESVVTHEMIHVLMDPVALALEDALKKTPSLYRSMHESFTTAIEGAFREIRGRVVRSGR